MAKVAESLRNLSQQCRQAKCSSTLSYQAHQASFDKLKNLSARAQTDRECREDGRSFAHSTTVRGQLLGIRYSNGMNQIRDTVAFEGSRAIDGKRAWRFMYRQHYLRWLAVRPAAAVAKL